MKLDRQKILSSYPWLRDRDRKFIVSASYDGMACASFLAHHFHWTLEGYYDLSSIWLSEEGINNSKDLIWVDLDIVPKAGKTLGGHIVMLDKQLPAGLKSSCNPNILHNISSDSFNQKYPLSTLSFLLWLFNISIPANNMAQFLVLHSDSTWLKYQKYTKNFSNWLSILDDYRWDTLFKNIDSIDFEKNIDQKFYPLMIQMSASSGFSKLQSKHLHIKSREYQFNPDWDEDVIFNLFDLFGQYLFWGPPMLPQIVRKIKGKKYSISIEDVKGMGLNNFIKKNKVFSYAITSSKTIKYTIFETIK